MRKDVNFFLLEQPFLLEKENVGEKKIKRFLSETLKFKKFKVPCEPKALRILTGILSYTIINPKGFSFFGNLTLSFFSKKKERGE